MLLWDILRLDMLRLEMGLCPTFIPPLLTPPTIETLALLLLLLLFMLPVWPTFEYAGWPRSSDFIVDSSSSFINTNAAARIEAGDVACSVSLGFLPPAPPPAPGPDRAAG